MPRLIVPSEVVAQLREIVPRSREAGEEMGGLLTVSLADRVVKFVPLDNTARASSREHTYVFDKRQLARFDTEYRRRPDLAYRLGSFHTQPHATHLSDADMEAFAEAGSAFNVVANWAGEFACWSPRGEPIELVLEQ
jgi:hypothetical protein